MLIIIVSEIHLCCLRRTSRVAAWIAIAREVSGDLSAASTMRMSLHPWLSRETAAESPVGPAPTIKMDVCSGSMVDNV